MEEQQSDQSLQQYFQAHIDHFTKYVTTYYPNYLQYFSEMNNKTCSIDDVRDINTTITKIAFSYYDRFYNNKYEFYDFKRLLITYMVQTYIKRQENLMLSLTFITPNRAVTVFITDHNKEYTLLLQCGYSKKKYSFVKGAIEPGESPELAASRELYEELGVRREFKDIDAPWVSDENEEFPVQRLVIDTDYQLMYVFYIKMDLNQQFIPLSDEEASLVVKIPIILLKQSNNIIENILTKPFSNRDVMNKIFMHFNI